VVQEGIEFLKKGTRAATGSSKKKTVRQRISVMGERKTKSSQKKETMIAETIKMHFNGEAWHEWPEFALSFLALGADEGGWKQTLEMKLDLQVAANKRLNKMAWCYLTNMEGDALDEMDMIPDKNAYEVWHHLKSKYEPRKEKTHDYLEMKFVQSELESLKTVNDIWEFDIMDENGDKVKTESIREEGVIEDIAVESEWEADETVQEQHEPLVEGKKTSQTGKKAMRSMIGCQWSQGRLMLSQVVMTSMLKKIMRSFQ